MANIDNKEIKFTGDPVAFDGVEGKRDPKTGKGRFDLIPEEVFEPLFDRVHKLETTEPYTVDCTPASILNDIANEDMLDAIIKITILKYYKTNPAILPETEVLSAKHLLPKNMEAGTFLECCWDMFMDLAIHFQKGAEHYGERNCQKGIPKWSFKDSAMRHASQTFAGKTDEPHTISVVWNCWLFVWSEIHERQKAEGESDTTTFGMAFKILRDRRKEAKKELFDIPSDSPEFKEKKNNIDEMRQMMADLMKVAEENEFPIVTAIQHSYNREEVEAIKEETRKETVEDYLTKRENIKTIIQTIVKKFGAPGVCDIIGALDEFDWCKGGVFSNWFSKFMDTQEGKERAIWWYSPADLFNQLIDRVSGQRGRHDYHDFVPLLLQLNSTYAEFLYDDKTKE